MFAMTLAIEQCWKLIVLEVQAEMGPSSSLYDDESLSQV